MNMIAKEIRKDIIEMVYRVSSGHIGGALSAVEIMYVLYFDVMNIDAKNPLMEDRDYFILSKGHASSVLYSTLAHRGYFSTDELKTFRKFGSNLQGHPDRKKVVGVEASTGSLGQGVCIATGCALSLKTDKKNNRVFVLVGDGEIQEGSFWEASMFASHYKLDNLTYILDYNGLQIDGSNDDIMSLGDIEAKMKAFGFDVYKVDGHNEVELKEIFEKQNSLNKPKFVIAKTIKGKGISFMENNAAWHGRPPTQEEYEKSIKELEDL